MHTIISLENIISQRDTLIRSLELEVCFLTRTKLEKNLIEFVLLQLHTHRSTSHNHQHQSSAPSISLPPPPNANLQFHRALPLPGPPESPNMDRSRSVSLEPPRLAKFEPSSQNMNHGKLPSISAWSAETRAVYDGRTSTIPSHIGPRISLPIYNQELHLEHQAYNQQKAPANTANGILAHPIGESYAPRLAPAPPSLRSSVPTTTPYFAEGSIVHILKGRWSDEEDGMYKPLKKARILTTMPSNQAALRDAFDKSTRNKQPPNWTFISSKVPTRTTTQCVARWQESLDPFVRKSKWSIEEDSLLKEGISKHGGCWVKVAALIPGRTQRQARTRWLQIRHRLPSNLAQAVPSIDSEAYAQVNSSPNSSRLSDRSN